MRLSKFKNLIFIGSPILIWMGAIKQILFYRSFNFNIVQFIDLAEILILFLNDIFYLISMLIFGIVFELFRISRYEIEGIKEIRTNINQSDKFGKRILDYLSLYSYGILIVITLGLMDLIIFLILDTVNLNLHTLFVTLGTLNLFVILWEEVKFKFNRLFSAQISPLIKNMMFFIIMISPVFYLTINNKVNSIRNDKLYYGTEIHYKDLDDNIKFISDSTSYYIGKTKSYVFIFQELDNSTKVIPIKDINEIIIRSK